LFITRLLLARRILSGLVPVVMTGSLMWSAPGHTQVCEDIDGDGWGWDGQDTCIVPQQTSSAAALACVDDDGDGYGWDGNDTCLITSPAAQASAASAPSAAAGVCIDDDGDGWGWNGVDSCVVGIVQPAPIQQPVTPVTPVVSAPLTGNSGFNRQRDLVAIHFDHAPDRDDGHAAVAALMVRDKMGLNVQVVAGTYGVYSAGRYDAESERVMAAVWGSECCSVGQ